MVNINSTLQTIECALTAQPNVSGLDAHWAKRNTGHNDLRYAGYFLINIHTLSAGPSLWTFSYGITLRWMIYCSGSVE